jgi:hypothetical protein
MESYGGSCETTTIKSTSQVRVNGDLSKLFLECAVRPRGLSTLLFDIFIQSGLVAGLHDTCSEHGIMGRRPM